jgi:hypothetical protein
LNEISPLVGGQVQLSHPIVVIHNAFQSSRASIVKVRGMLPQPAQGVVRYALLAVRAAYEPSIPISEGACNVPALLSVLVAPTWQRAQDWSNTALPRSAAVVSKLPPGAFSRRMISSSRAKPQHSLGEHPDALFVRSELCR